MADEEIKPTKKVVKKKTAKAAAKKKAVSKKTTTKKTASRKKVATKKAATKKTVKKKATTAASAAKGKPVSAEERWHMVAVAAFYKAEKRGFAAGNAEKDWSEAEKEIDALLKMQGKA